MSFFSTFTQGLYPGEVILLIVGIVLFVVFIFAFLYQLMHQRSFTALLGFFIIPIICVGYPSIQSIQYKDGVVTVQNATTQLLNNPEDPQARQTLEQQSQKIASRAASNPADTVTLAKAQFALGHEEDAAKNLEKALQAKADLPEALALKTKMQVAQNLQSLAAKVEQEPTNQEAKADLQKNVTAAAQYKWANPTAITSLAQAQTALGDHAAAAVTVNKVLAITPQSPTALKLKQTIAARAAIRQ
jgi:tetratricopeptide (TPR) repeat protein